MTLLEFEREGYRFALPLAGVKRVVPSAAPTPLPGAPASVIGVLNVGGELVAVLEFALLAGLPTNPVRMSQRLLVIELAGFLAGLFVDAILGVTERCVEPTHELRQRLGSDKAVSGMVRLDDGLCIIVDPEKFLLESERMQLDEAFKKAEREAG